MINKQENNSGGIHLGKKDSQLTIRINSSEREDFVALCEEMDTSAAREIRRFIRQFLKEHRIVN